jgi:uncharacterized protein (DUF1778 family)
VASVVCALHSEYRGDVIAAYPESGNYFGRRTADLAAPDLYGVKSYMNGERCGMPSVARNKTSRLDARVTPDLLQQLRRVAEIQGRSVSDYVTATLREAVQKDIAEMEVIRLSREASERFAAALIDPPDPVPALRRAFEQRQRPVKQG